MWGSIAARRVMVILVVVGIRWSGRGKGRRRIAEHFLPVARPRREKMSGLILEAKPGPMLEMIQETAFLVM